MTPKPGCFIKIPFVWQPGCPVPPSEEWLRFRAAGYLERTPWERPISWPPPQEASA